MDKVDLFEKHHIESFNSDFDKLKEHFDTDEKVSCYLHWLMLRELRLISDDLDSIDRKTAE